MPVYDYLCSFCDHRADILHGINDPGPAFCPSCGHEGTMRKQFTTPTIHFKGSGWAKKDRGGSSSTRAAAAASSGSASSSGTDSKASGGETGSAASGSSGGSGSADSSGSSSSGSSPSSSGD